MLGMFSFPGFPPGVKWLLIANIGIFLLEAIEGILGLGKLFSLFELVPAAVVRVFMVWQLATYLFLHGGFGHIIWNMLALWMFGADSGAPVGHAPLSAVLLLLRRGRGPLRRPARTTCCPGAIPCPAPSARPARSSAS